MRMRTKATQIRVRLGLGRMSPGEKLVLAKGVYSGLKDNPDFPHPPVDLDKFKGAIDGLASAEGETVGGGRMATAERNRQEEVLARILRQLGRYVVFKSDGDMETLLSSGFSALSNDRKQRAPLSESIRKIEYGNTSGQLRIRLIAVPDAYCYELRWAPVDSDGAPGAWTSRPVITTRPPTLIDGLTPGTTYVFEARALIDSGHTDWRGPVRWICA